MIDMHCHILHGIDDGARTLDEALALCAIAEKQGITGIITTPHFADYDEVGDFIRVRGNRLEQLKIELDAMDSDLEIFTGCELYLDELIFSAPDLDAVTLNNSRYMLCEFSLRDFDCGDALEWIDELIRRGYTPILAHPERYGTFHRTPEYINDFAEKKILFQLNADSLTGDNGRACFALACEMLRNNLADFIGSDAHSAKYRPNDLMNKTKYFPDFIDYDTLEKLLDINPSLVINDKRITPPERGII